MGNTWPWSGFQEAAKVPWPNALDNCTGTSGGKILIDQKDVSQLSKADMAGSIGFVSQAPFIFEGSIQENLLYAYWAQMDPDDAVTLPSLDDQTLILQQTGLFIDVLRFGLDMVLEQQKHED